MKSQSTKGFTLIELMIVVAIIGVLAVTIVPALTGAQARARDAGRIASLQNITAVLETYYSDEGVYITSHGNGTVTASDTGVNYCISGPAGGTARNFEKMFKGGQVPLNPQKTSKSGLCNTGGAYAYTDLEKDGVSGAGYILIADVESPTKANADITKMTTALLDVNGTTPYETVKGTTIVEWRKITNETSGGTEVIGAKGSVYAMTN